MGIAVGDPINRVNLLYLIGVDRIMSALRSTADLGAGSLALPLLTEDIEEIPTRKI